jgi:hypothetical protein
MHDVLRGGSWQNAHPEQLQALFSTKGIRENVINVGRLGGAGSLLRLFDQRDSKR